MRDFHCPILIRLVYKRMENSHNGETLQEGGVLEPFMVGVGRGSRSTVQGNEILRMALRKARNHYQQRNTKLDRTNRMNVSGTVRPRFIGSYAHRRSKLTPVCGTE